MNKSEGRPPDEPQGAGEDLKTMAKAGPAGALVVTMIVVGVVGLIILGMLLLVSPD